MHANTPQPLLPGKKSDETNKFKCNVTWHDKSIASRSEAVLINRCSFCGIVKLVIALQIIKRVNHGVAPSSSRWQWIRQSESVIKAMRMAPSPAGKGAGVNLPRQSALGPGCLAQGRASGLSSRKREIVRM